MVEPPADAPLPPAARFTRNLAFVATAALAAGALRVAWHRPLVVGALLCGVAAALLHRAYERRRVRRTLLRGDVDAALATWSRSLGRVPHAATMGPLMTATALAAFGRVAGARDALAAAERGPAWNAALEHRLFVDALLLTFEGDREGALDAAYRIARLPVPRASAATRGRIFLLRGAIGAFARAFAHASLPGDRAVLELASHASPLVSWAMRYAAAVVAIDQGDFPAASSFLVDAPSWPVESALRAFHAEIADQIATRARPQSSS